MRNHQYYGIIVTVVAVLLLLAFWTYFTRVEQTLASEATISETGECIHPEGLLCPFQRIGELAPFKYSVLAITALMLIVGIYMIVVPPKAVSLTKAPTAVPVRGPLNAEEKSVVSVLETSSDPVYQGDLVQHLGWSKVKVTRVLDKLEAKGLVERKRRGMTNLVILKQAQ